MIHEDLTTWTTKRLRSKMLELDLEIVQIQEELESRGK